MQKYCFFLTYANKNAKILEWVADAEVYAYGVECGGNVEVGVDRLCGVGFAFLVISICLVWCVDTNADIETNHKSVYVKTQAGAGAQSNLFGKLGVTEDAVIQRLVGVQVGEVLFMTDCLEDVVERVPVPYVTGVHESGSEEFPYNREAELEIRLQFDVPGVEETLVVFGGIEVSGSVCIWRSGTQTKRSSCMEGFGEGCEKGVAKRDIRAGKQARSDTNLIREIELVAQFEREFDELIERDIA